MRIVATSDTHFNVPPDVATRLIPDGDILVHAGDLMYQGTPDEWPVVTEWLANMPHKHKIYVPGNHDFHTALYMGIARADLRRRCGVHMLTVETGNRLVLPNKMQLVGLPFVTGLPGWAYNTSEDALDAFLSELQPADIVVSHAPVYRHLDKVNPKESVGCVAYNRWWTKHSAEIKHWINGHIHESYGTEKDEGTTFYNVCMCDREYKQVNPAMVIDL